MALADARALLHLLQQGDLDAAIDAGLMDWAAHSNDGLDDAGRTLLTQIRDRLHRAWAARERYHARRARLERRAARAVPPATESTPSAPSLPPTAAAILTLGEEGLKRHIATIGLYNAKASNIIATCRRLLDYHNGGVLHDRAALEALPGVGRKTANVVLNTVFGEPAIAVDTHIFRLANRIGLAPGKTVREVEDGLMKVIPKRWQQGAHHWLILHGRYVCKARKPDCPHCVIADVCRFEDKTRDERTAKSRQA